MSLNKVVIHGNLGNDPELKTSKDGKSFCKFSIATSDGWGENKKTNWHNITVFGKSADIISKYVKKGDEIIVNGSIDYNKYEDKYYTSILVDDFSLCRNLLKEESRPQPKKETYEPQSEDIPGLDDLDF